MPEVSPLCALAAVALAFGLWMPYLVMNWLRHCAEQASWDAMLARIERRAKE